MAQQPFLAKVIGIPHIPSVTQVNIRTGPGTNYQLAFKVAVGTTNLPIIEVQADAENKNKQGKVYQWFRIQFPQGVGWCRDDLIEIWGDGSATGYPVLYGPTTAFNLTRIVASVPPGAETAATGTAPQQSTTVTSAWQPSTQQQQPVTSAWQPVTSAWQPSTQQPSTSTEVVTIEQPIVPTATQPSTSSEVVTTAQPIVPQPAAPTGPATATSISKTGGNTRPGPGTGHAPVVVKFTYKDTATILDAKLGDDGKPLYWVKISYQGKEAWIREDLVRVSGNFTPFGLNAPDKYPAPVRDTWWIRGWDLDGSIWRTGSHNGWDLGGVKGSTPMLAGPQGGVVYDVRFCQKCGAAGMSAPEKGYSLGDSRVWNDAGWNYGYGHFIVVGYENSKLPESTKQYLADNGKAGWHIFVLHAHMHDLMVKKDDVLSPNQQIGTLGNSGNSEGPHLHLEVRASQSMTPNGWASLKGGLMSPGSLFLR